MDRKSWHLAAADSGNLLRRMLERDETSRADVGMSTWTGLMEAIGRREPPERAEEGAFDDEMLREWARVNLDSDVADRAVEEVAAVAAAKAAEAAAAVAAEHPKESDEEEGNGMGSGTAAATKLASSAGDVFPDCENVQPRQRKRRNKLTPKDLTGSVLRSGVPSQYILQQQYLHKGVVVILADKPEMSIGIVVNRPSSSVVQFRSTGQQRRINLGGEQQIGSVQMLLFHASPDLAAAGKSQRVGDSGLWQISVTEADALMQNKDLDVTCADFLVVSGVMVWMGGALKESLENGALEIIPNPPASVPWRDVIALGKDPKSSDSERLEGGTAIWQELFALSPSCAETDEEREKLADKALSKFAEVFLSDDDTDAASD